MEIINAKTFLFYFALFLAIGILSIIPPLNMYIIGFFWSFLFIVFVTPALIFILLLFSAYKVIRGNRLYIVPLIVHGLGLILNITVLLVITYKIYHL